LVKVLSKDKTLSASLVRVTWFLGVTRLGMEAVKEENNMTCNARYSNFKLFVEEMSFS
jgi:hypothetical protein